MLQAIGTKSALVITTHFRSVSKMTPVATYVFLDLETTGIPDQENNRTKITELSLVAVKRDHMLDTRPGATPRVQNKLTLCFNPGKLIQPTCTDVTGLCNDLLEHETYFNTQVFDVINNFLNLLTKPVCLVAQNGLNFDYPILKNHLEKLNVSFCDDLLCADCFHAFYDILEAKKRADLSETENTTIIQAKSVPGQEETCLKTEEKIALEMVDGTLLGQEELMLPNTLAMKLKNETTPKQAPRPVATTPTKNNPNKASKARRKFPWSQGSRPTEKYKLKDIYERLLNRPAIDAHRAENDCVLALECSVCLAKDFVKWVDENNVPFSEVNSMKIGVRLGE